MKFLFLTFEFCFFSEAIVVVLSSEKDAVRNALSDYNLKIKLDLVSIPENEDWGTADTLRHIKDRIKVKFIFIFPILISVRLVTQCWIVHVLMNYLSNSAGSRKLFYELFDFFQAMQLKMQDCKVLVQV